jgi:anti-sigma-K factor RskA
MTDRDRTPDGRECGADVAAYALGALEPAEVTEFRRHLETCAICRDELNAFKGVVDALPLSVPPQRAPESLRRNVLREVVGESAATTTGDRRAAPRARRRARRWSLSQPVLALGAVLAVAVAVFVGVQLGSSPSGHTRVIQADVTGSGTAQLRIAGGHASLVVQHFSPPPAGKIYELWLQRGHGAPSPTTALFSVTSAGSAQVGVPGSLNGVSAVLVTPEPDGGSQAPTHAPVIDASLS